MRWIFATFVFVLLAAIAFVRWFLPVDRTAPNFSQYTGFDGYFTANPPSGRLPSPEEQALLRRFQPRLFKGKGSEEPIDFYADYIAQGTLRDAQGRLIADAVTPEILNAHKGEPLTVFTHQPVQGRAVAPAILGRIDRINAQDAPLNLDLTVLTYHAVFRTSGLPAGLSWWQEWGARIVGDVNDWHQLDHYTAASVVLDPEMRPVALMLQQHNYQRSYVVGEGVALPADGRFGVDIALRSNELYPHLEGRQMRRAVSFLSPANFAYMIGSGPKPMMAANDVTDSGEEVEAALAFLPPSDAFYTFKGYLGARRALPGRDGPPGAQYNTLPPFKPLGMQIALAYWREGNAGDAEPVAGASGEADRMGFAMRQAEAFRASVACLRLGEAGCGTK